MEKLQELIKERLIAGEDVLVSGFGKLLVKDKRARRGSPTFAETMVDPMITACYEGILALRAFHHRLLHVFLGRMICWGTPRSS